MIETKRSDDFFVPIEITITSRQSLNELVAVLGDSGRLTKPGFEKIYELYEKLCQSETK